MLVLFYFYAIFVFILNLFLVAKKENQIQILYQEMDDLKMSCEGKVDKQLMKSLVLGYFVTPQDKRHEVERLLARILDFNQQEMDKAKIVIGRDRMRTPSGNSFYTPLNDLFYDEKEGQ